MLRRAATVSCDNAGVDVSEAKAGGGDSPCRPKGEVSVFRLTAVAPSLMWAGSGSSLISRLWTPGAVGAGRTGRLLWLLVDLLLPPTGGGGALRTGVCGGDLQVGVVPLEVLLVLCRCSSRAFARSCLF